MRTHNLKQTLIALDQFLFCLTGLILSLFNSKISVYADFTISAQAYRLELRNTWYGRLMRKSIDLLFSPFEKEHCKKSYEAEMSHGHLPQD